MSAARPIVAAQMASETVQATWIGPYVAETPQHGLLIPGETTVEISQGEAETSDHWMVSGAQKPGAGKPKAKAAEHDVEAGS